MTEKAPKIKAIIFDIDGTLYSNTLSFLFGAKIYLRNILWIIRFAKMRSKLRKLLNKTPFDIDVSDATRSEATEIFNKKSREIFKQLTGLNSKQSNYILQKHIYFAWIKAIKQTPLRFGFRSLLKDLKNKNLKLGILSDFQAEAKIRNWHLTHYFDSIICAEDYGVLKPDPRIFKLACKKLQVSESETLYIGNHYYYDGIGAANAGLIPLLFYNKATIKKLMHHENKIYTFRTMFGFKKLLSKFIKLGDE